MLLGLVAVMALVGSAEAGRNDAEWNPPTRFDKPFAGKMVLRKLPQRLVIGACDSLFSKWSKRFPALKQIETSFTQRGCAVRVSPALCYVIIMNEPKFGTTPKAALRHETGHCNGWSGGHED